MVYGAFELGMLQFEGNLKSENHCSIFKTLKLQHLYLNFQLCYVGIKLKVEKLFYEIDSGMRLRKCVEVQENWTQCHGDRD